MPPFPLRDKAGCPQDVGGWVWVGGGLGSGAPPTDWAQLGADPTAAGSSKDVVGFTVPGCRLLNVRHCRVEGPSAAGPIGDLNSSQALPASLPALNGRPGLDCVPLAIPEPGAQALMAVSPAGSLR